MVSVHGAKLRNDWTRLNMNERFVRQERLREIGAAGQARLCGATTFIPDDATAETARAYLSRSGIGTIVTRGEHSDFPHAGLFQFETCRTFACGAWIATRRIVEILEL